MTAALTNAELLQAMREAVADMPETLCKHADKADEVKCYDCDQCVHEATLTVIRERIASAIEDEETKELVLGTKIKKKPVKLVPPPNDEIHVRFYKWRGGRGWHWEVSLPRDTTERGYVLKPTDEFYWRKEYGGYAMTLWGAKFSVTQAKKKIARHLEGSDLTYTEKLIPTKRKPIGKLV